MSIELVMPSNHLIPCCPLLLLPSIFPSIIVCTEIMIFNQQCPKFLLPSFLTTCHTDASAPAFSAAAISRRVHRTPRRGGFTCPSRVTGSRVWRRQMYTYVLTKQSHKSSLDVLQQWTVNQNTGRPHNGIRHGLWKSERDQCLMTWKDTHRYHLLIKKEL